MAKDTNPTETITITNFQGRLTRILNGELNSGFAKFSTSFGYDPFTKPMNLTWLEQPADISGVTDLVLAGKTRFLGESNPSAYLIGSTGNLYKIQINSNTSAAIHSVIGISSVKSGNPTYLKGADLDFFGSNEKIYVSSDSQVNSINFDGSADSVIGNVANYAANVFRPLKKFIGALAFGNGPTIGIIDATGTVTSSVVGVSSTVGNIYSQLIPPLPSSTRVKDIDVSPDNNYLYIAASEVDYENISVATTPNLLNTVPAESKLFYWNGSDATVTAATTIPTNLLSALQTYLQRNYFFTSDSFGAALNTETEKILTLYNNKAPLPNATGVNGNFIFWSAPERLPTSVTDSTPALFATMFYFGSLDQENPPGLYRVLHKISGGLFRGNVVEMPFNMLASVHYSDANNAQSSVITAGIGTHYYSTHEVSANTTNTGSVFGFKRFSIPASGTGEPQFGVYETQTQLFSKRISIKQIRVYTEPTATGNGFSLDLIGSDGNIITNGSFSYSYAAGSDLTSLKGPLQRINFNPNTVTTYSLGIRISNTGSTNMTIKKVEIDWSYSGK